MYQRSICTLGVRGCLSFIRLSQVSSTSSLLTFLDPLFFFGGWGGVFPCIGGPLAASRVSIDYMPGALSHTNTPVVTTKDISRNCQMSPEVGLGNLLD